MDGEIINFTVLATLGTAGRIDPTAGLASEAGMRLWVPFGMLAVGAAIVLYVARTLRRSARNASTGNIDLIAPIASIRAGLSHWRVRRSRDEHDGTAHNPHQFGSLTDGNAPLYSPHPPHSSHSHTGVSGPASFTPATAARTIAELQRLHRDLVELAQRQAVEADIRAARLEELIARADERLDRLSRVVRAPMSSVAGSIQPAPPVASKQAQPEIRVLATSPALPAPVLVGSPNPGAAVASAAHAANFGSGNKSAPDALQREVCRLAEEGLSTMDIAKRLGQHTGKVELILALRR